MAIDPILEQIERAQTGAGRDYEQATSRIEDVYKALANELAPLQNRYDQSAAGIQQDLTSQLGGLAGLLSPQSGAGPGEASAATDLFATLGAGGQQMLASDRSRNLGYSTSTARQVPLDATELQRNYLQDYQDLIDDLKQQRVDVMQDVPTQVLARLDALRSARQQNRLANAELELRKTIANKQERRADRGQRAAEEVLTDAQRRERLGGRIQDTTKDLRRIKKKIAPLKYESGNYRNANEWEAEALPDLLKLRRKKRVTKRKIENLKKRKRRV
jgi:hypothetical protein